MVQSFKNFLTRLIKTETIRDRGYKKVKLKIQQDNLALFRRKHGVAHEEKSEKELEN